MKTARKLASKNDAALWLFAFALQASLACRGMAADSRGMDFWVAFPPGLNQPALLITGEEDATGTVTAPGIGFSESFTIQGGESIKVKLPYSAAVGIDCIDCIELKGVHVEASCEVSVYGIGDDIRIRAAYLAFPTEGLGMRYFIHSLWNRVDVNTTCQSSLDGDGCGSEFVVLATKDATTVTIIPSETTGTRPEGIPYTIELDQGQTYRLVNIDLGGFDLTGSLITASKPVAVYGGHTIRWIPYSDELICCVDAQVSEIPPAADLGTDYFMVPYAKRSGGDVLRVAALQDGTQVHIDGSLAANLDQGEIFEKVGVTAPLHITANFPVLAAQLMQGFGIDNYTGDGEIMILTATSRFLDRHIVTTDLLGSWSYQFLNLVVPTSAINTLRLDGGAIPSIYFSPIGTSGYSYARRSVLSGAHILSCSVPFGIYVYGMAYHDSYAYSGGMKLGTTLDLPRLKIHIDPSTAFVSAGSDICIRAFVTDQYGIPQAGVPVDLSCTGVNSWWAVEMTDSGGRCSRCYGSKYLGADFIRVAAPCVCGLDCLANSFVYWLAPPPEGPYKGPLRVFPNPFSREKAVGGLVKFEGLDLDSHVRIYTIRGLLVWEGIVERPYILEWNGHNDAGKPVAPGTYLWVAESKSSKNSGTLIVE